MSKYKIVEHVKPAKGEKLVLKCKIWVDDRKISFQIDEQHFPEDITINTPYLNVGSYCFPELGMYSIYLRGENTFEDNSIAVRSFWSNAERDEYLEDMKNSLKYAVKSVQSQYSLN